MDELVRTPDLSTDQNTITCSLGEWEADALTKRFSHLCERIEKSIAQQRVIQERVLLDFSRMFSTVVENKINIETIAFQNLSSRISDYWHYELKHETNSKRGYSYVRLYQMVTMIHTFGTDCKLEYRVHSELMADQYDKDLVKQIRQTPGITHKKLRGISEATSDELDKRLQMLENRGHVTGQRSGEERYYVLTNSGDTLYRQLTMKYPNHWVDQWSNERILVFCFILIFLKQHRNRSMTVQDVERQIAACNDRTIENLFDAIISNEAKKKTTLEYRLRAEEPDIYIEEHVTKKGFALQLLLEKVVQSKWIKNLLIYANE